MLEAETPSPPLAQSVVRAAPAPERYSYPQLYADLCDAKLSRLFFGSIGTMMYEASGYCYWDLYTDILEAIRVQSGCPDGATWWSHEPQMFEMPTKDVWYVAGAADIDPYSVFLRRLHRISCDGGRHVWRVIGTKIQCEHCDIV